MADILTNKSDKTAIRLVLGVDDTDVSDIVLDSIIGIQAAEIRVKERITNWEVVLAATDEDTTRLKLGTIYFTAANLVPRLRNLLRPGEKVAELVLGKIDWNNFKEELLGLANEMLAEIGSTSDATFTLFTVDGPSRKFRELDAIAMSDTAEFQNV